MEADTCVAPYPLILLAGGKASRMGAPKGLLPLRDRPFLQWQLERFRAAGGRRAVVVLGFEPAAYVACLVGLSEVCNLALAKALNPKPDRGPFSSIQAGWRESERAFVSAPGAYILPIDVPAPSPAVWADLAAAGSQVAIPSLDGRGGHPVLLQRQVMLSLMACSPEDRLDHALARLNPGPRVPVRDANIRRNLNTPQAWDEFTRSLTSCELDGQRGTV